MAPWRFSGPTLGHDTLERPTTTLSSSRHSHVGSQCRRNFFFAISRFQHARRHIMSASQTETIIPLETPALGLQDNSGPHAAVTVTETWKCPRRNIFKLAAIYLEGVRP